jgi:hypothetical protein
VIDTAHRIKQLCGQVFRYAVVTGSAERDVTSDLKDALQKKVKVHHAAVTDPKAAGELLRAHLRLHGPPHHRGGAETGSAGVCKAPVNCAPLNGQRSTLRLLNGAYRAAR